MIRISKAFANIDVGVAMLFQAITNTNIKYPAWFCKGKTPLLRKPGEFNVLAKSRLILDEMCRLYRKFASYLRRVLCKTRLIFPRVNGPIDPRRLSSYF